MGRKKNKQKKNKNSAKTTHDDRIIQEVGVSPEQEEEPSTPEYNVRSEECNDTSSNTKNIPETVQNDLKFEKYRPNSERVIGREYFIHSLCQICKEELSDRVLCPKCRLISYCSQKHRKQHLTEHTDLCEAITSVCADRQVEHIMQGSLDCDAESFRIFRFRNMVECETKVERSLESWEREMFIFPNVCVTCHEYNSERLIVCDRCHHSAFCKGHRIDSHDKWCECLLRYKNIIKDQNRFGIVCPSIPKTKLSLVSPKLLDMQHAFAGISEYIDIFEYFELTEITTYPFTALNALLVTNKNLQGQKKIILHVVGAEADFEINRPEKWEYYFLHLIPELQNLEIEFIGPELKPTAEQNVTTVCSKCEAANKSMTLRFHRQLYHTLCQKKNFSKPHLICVFNPGLYRTTGFNNQDTWSPSIDSMFAHDCPVLTTAYTHKEIHLDVLRVKQTQNIFLDKEPTLNPLSSLKPSLNFVSDEDSPVIFKNQYYCIMCKA